MEIINRSAESLGRLYSWLPKTLRAEKVVFLPDACPGKSPLPTGTVVLTHQPDWRRFAISDCGCGMRLIRSVLSNRDLKQAQWDELSDRLRGNKGRLGDLGGGNHFLDALEPVDGGPVHFLIHTGSRNESGLVDEFVDQAAVFDREFARIVEWAEENRATIQREVESVFGRTDVVLDLPHNSFEKLDDGGVIIRKGSVRLLPGERSILPSHMAGEVVLVQATSGIANALNSMSHGTGRSMPRGESKDAATSYNFEELRRKILVADGISDSSLRSEGPYAYRDLDDCLSLISDIVHVELRFRVVAYMGRL